jgi:hypothetical protein
MNSWFLYEVTVFSMGPFSAKNAYFLGKLITAMSVMVLGSGLTAPFGSNPTVGRSSVSLRPSTIGHIVRYDVVCFFFFC